MKIGHILLMILLCFTINACKPEPTNEQVKVSPEIANTVPSLPDENATTVNCHFVLGFDAWEPYQYVDVGGRVAGLDIELVAAVAERMGCELTYQQGTWVDLLMALKEGEFDILLGASKTESREQFAFFSDPYRMEEFSLYIRKEDTDKAEYKTLTDFISNDSKIGIVGDYVYGPEVSILLDGADTSKYFVNAIMGELNVARLLDGDIDGFLEDSFVGATLLRRKALQDYIVAHGLTIHTGDAYVMFSQKSVSLEQRDTFNEQLQKVKETEHYQDILDKYSF